MADTRGGRTAGVGMSAVAPTHPDVHDEPYMPEHHAMADIETLATDPNAVVVSIGIAIYNPADDVRTKPIATAHYVINPTEQIIKGRHVNPDTVKWWSEQHPKAIESITTNGIDPMLTAREALECMQMLFTSYNVVAIWANGSDFDNVIINSLCRTMGVTEVIHFRKSRCYRTLRAMFGGMVGAEASQDRAAVHHNALEDALYQMRQHKRIHAELVKRGYGL